jgi:hypothetical protein
MVATRLVRDSVDGNISNYDPVANESGVGCGKMEDVERCRISLGSHFGIP